MQVSSCIKLNLLILVYFIKHGNAAYVEKNIERDSIFLVLDNGDYFGDIDFTRST